MTMNPDPQQSGLFGFLQGLRKPDEQTGLSPLQRFGAALDPLILPAMRAGEQIRAQGAQKVAQGNKNRTIEMLEQAGQTELANALKTGAIDVKSAASLMFQRAAEERQLAREKELLEYRSKLTKTPTSIQEYNLAVSQGYKGSFEQWESLGKKKTEFGTIPAGYQLVEGTDSQGRPTYSMTPVKGSPDYVDEQKRIEQQKLADQGKIGSTLSFYSAGERVIDQIDNNPSIIPKTGVVSGLVRDTIFGQTQKNVAEDLAIMEAQMQFETLAQLKAQSPSGASGLGQLTDSERRALGKVKYNFDSLQGEEAIKRNIRSAMLFRSYFENGLLDAKTNTYRNATEEELELMTKGINPFTQEGGPKLIGVERYLKANPSKNIEVINGVTIEELP